MSNTPLASCFLMSNAVAVFLFTSNMTWDDKQTGLSFTAMICLSSHSTTFNHSTPTANIPRGLLAETSRHQAWVPTSCLSSGDTALIMRDCFRYLLFLVWVIWPPDSFSPNSTSIDL